MSKGTSSGASSSSRTQTPSNRSEASSSRPRPVNLPSLEVLSSVSTVPFVDTHTHLHYVLERLQGPPLNLKSYSELRDLHFPPNLEYCINVLCDPESLSSDQLFPDTFMDWRVQAEQPFIYLSAGIHPHNAKIYNDYIESLLLKILDHPKTIAFGEIGLDYHYDNSPRDVQRNVFIRQVQKAVELNKPLVIHTREAEQDTYDILTKHVPANWHIHVHCFTDTPNFARRLLSHFENLYIGITGIVTFGSAKNTQNIIRHVVPMNRFLLETDAPYMIPAKLNRNKRSHERVTVCHSGMIPLIAEKIAQIKGIGVDEVMEEARKNTRTMYNI